MGLLFNVRAALDLRSSGERGDPATRGFSYSLNVSLRPSSPGGLVWIDPGRSGQLVSFTEPSLHVWKSDARSGDREKGLHAWAIATGGENGIQ